MVKIKNGGVVLPELVGQKVSIYTMGGNEVSGTVVLVTEKFAQLEDVIVRNSQNQIRGRYKYQFVQLMNVASFGILRR